MNFLRSFRRLSRKPRRNQALPVETLESLEKRTLLVGQVSALVSGNDLIIRGDNSANQIEISIHEGNVAVRPKNGTRINGARGQFIAFADSNRIPGNVSINLSQGDDSVVFGRELIVQGNVRYRGGRHNDTLGLDNVVVRGNLVFKGGDGDDAVSLQDSRIVKQTVLSMSLGNDLASIVTSDLRGNLKVYGSRGDDAVVVDDSDVRAKVLLDMHSGNDQVDLNNIRTDEYLNVRTHNGDDSVRIDDSSVDGKARFFVGSGNDNLILGDGGSANGDDGTPSAGNVFKQNVRVLGQSGTDALEVDIDNDFRGRRRESSFEATAADTSSVDDSVTDASDLRDSVKDLIARSRTLTAGIPTDAENVFRSGTDADPLFVTNGETITVRGVSSNGAMITVDANGDGIFDEGSDTVQADGRYSIDVPVVDGLQALTIRTTDDRGEDLPGEDVTLAVDRVTGTVVRMTTDLGSFDVELFDVDAPNTVANFLSYFDDYGNNTIVHTSTNVDDEALIGSGAFRVDNDEISEVVGRDPIDSEFDLRNANLRGTLSMALIGENPDSGTNQWEINVSDNTNRNAVPHTVFGRVLGDVTEGSSGANMSVVDAIRNQGTFDVSGATGAGALTDTPLQNYTEFSAQLTGTISIPFSGSTVTGTGTRFLSEVRVGQQIRSLGQTFTVTSISSNTELFVSTSANQAVNDASAFENQPTDENYVVFSNIRSVLDRLP